MVTGDELEALQAWTTAVEAWPAGSHRWGQYAEPPPAEDYAIYQRANPNVAPPFGLPEAQPEPIELTFVPFRQLQLLQIDSAYVFGL